MRNQLASVEGLSVEISSAASVVAAARLRQEGTLDATDTIVCVFTSSGLKNAQVTQLDKPRFPTIDADWERFRQLMGDFS